MRWISRLTIAAATGSALLAGGLGPRTQMAGDIPPQATPTPSPVISPAPSAEASGRRLPEFFVMIDASHGGDDWGARLGPAGVLEKDVSLSLARQLKRQLEERGIAARLLRDSDVNLSLEQRAALSNEEHAGLYVALHAGQPGQGVRVYAPALLMAPSSHVGRFLPWESAQRGALEQSRIVAALVAGEVRKTGVTAAALGAALRPLNNVVAPAIAVEWAPGPEDPHSPQVQRAENQLASAIALAILASRGQQAGDQPAKAGSP